MKFTAKDVLGCESVSHDFEPGVTLVCGPNSAGKTSVATALMALVTHESNPKSLSTARLSNYLRIGARSGMASLGDVKWMPGKGVSVPPSEEMPSNKESAGLVDFCAAASAANGKARAKVWEALFMPEDVRSLLEPHWSAGTAILDSVEETILTHGWDDAIKIFEDRRKIAKRDWSNLTGKSYGVNVAKSWRPEGWRDELAGESRSSLQGLITDFREQHSHLVSVEAVSQDRIDRAQEIRDSEIPQAEQEAKEAEAEYESANASLAAERKGFSDCKKQLEKASNRFKEIKSILNSKPPHNCPSCNTGLVVDTAGKIALWTPPDTKVEELEAEQAELASKGKQLKSEYEVKKGNVDSLNAKVNEAHRKLGEAKGKVNLLKKQSSDASLKAVDLPDQSKVNELETQLEHAQADFLALETKIKSDKILGNIAVNSEIIDLLGPQGARSKVMGRGISKLNRMFESICKGTGWKPMHIDAGDYQSTSGEVPIQTAAANEKLKYQWACQIACAAFTKAQWVVLDAADTLRGDDWAGLVRLCDFTSDKVKVKHVVVCATIEDKSKIPEGWEGKALGLWN